MDTRRSYTMRARAASAAQTRQRILEAAFELQSRQLAAEISLEAVAARAGVSVQTVLRHFGSRAALFDATVTFARETIDQERRAPAGDVPGALRVLVDHYEKRGDMALMMLAQESTYEHVRRLADSGKARHRAWVGGVFEPQLAGLSATAREEALDLLVVATDVYTWKLLRKDRQLSRAQTEDRMNVLVRAVVSDIETKDGA